MADPRFFTRFPPRPLSELADIAGATLANPEDGACMIEDVAPLDTAGAGAISFLDNVRYKQAFTQTTASACIVSPKMVEFAPAGCRLVISNTPYKAYALIAQAFYPVKKPAAQISKLAVIGENVVIGEGCVIEPGVVIGAGAVIGAGTWVEAQTVIGPNVVIGSDCRIGSHVSISHALIGSGTRLYPGARIGQDGFGFAIDPAGHVKVPQLGRVIIGDHVEVGANTCIDRGAGPDTIIGDGAWIDNLVQIAHNVRVGKGCVLVGQCGIAGSAVLEDFSVLAAQSGVAGHITIGAGARIGAQSGVLKNVPSGEEHFGTPAQPLKKAMRQIAALKRLTKSQKSE
jgi:UDP-3-O-[3-hydroxymyristoyl] glucosamine N-acyltransferase